MQNSDGLTAEMPADKHDTIPHYIQSSVVTTEDWKKVEEERFQRGAFCLPDIEALKKIHTPDRDYPLGINCGSMIGKIRDMLTLEGLAYACYDYPEMVDDMVETCCALGEAVRPEVRHGGTLGALPSGHPTGGMIPCTTSALGTGTLTLNRIARQRLQREPASFLYINE